MSVPPIRYRLTRLTTLAEVEQGPRWSATEVATGHVAYSFRKMSRAAIVAFLAPFGTVVGGHSWSDTSPSRKRLLPAR